MSAGDAGLPGHPSRIAIPQGRPRHRRRPAFADHADDDFDPAPFEGQKRFLDDQGFGVAVRQLGVGDAPHPRTRRDLHRFGFQKIRHAQIFAQTQALLLRLIYYVYVIYRIAARTFWTMAGMGASGGKVWRGG